MSSCKLENATILRDFLNVWSWRQKRSNSARLRQFLKWTTSKTKQFCETSSILRKPASWIVAVCEQSEYKGVWVRSKEQRIAIWIYPGNKQAGAPPIDALFWTDRCASEPTEGRVRWAWDKRCQRYTSRLVHRMHWPRARCDLSAFISASVTILCCSCVQWP